MLRRIMPYLLIVMLVLIDVSIVPVFTASVYVLPLTLLFVMCVSMVMGRLHGILGALLGGLLIDILTGYPVGFMMVAYPACCFVVGLLAYDTDEMRAQQDYSRWKAFGRRALCVFVVMMLFEVVLIVYQYFHTALMNGWYFTDAFIRSLLASASVSAMYYIAVPLLLGKKDARVRIGSKREVRNL